jgi:PAS domain S-box-containing protein
VLYRSQSTLLLLGGSAPLVANIVFLSFPDRFGHIDLTPIAFIISGVFFAWAVFPFRRLDLRFLARASLVEAIPDAVLVLDTENKIIDLNPAARSLFSSADAEVIGKSVGTLLPGLEIHSPGTDHTDRTIKEVTLSVDGIPCCFEVHMSAVRRRAEQPPEQQVVVFRDITERKQAQQDRERFVEELEAKNTELERFTYTVSHDLKSPLITIKGFLGLLEQDASEGDKVRIEDDVVHIRHAAEAMQQMLDELLALSRVGRVAAPRQPVSLTALAEEAVELVGGQITERGVAVEIAPAMPVVLVDRLRMVEVFQNLFDNAVKFMGDQPEPHIAVGARENADEVVCYVSDNGSGIDPVHHERIFGLFDRLDKSAKGTGIGLTLVHRIVEVHGGRIWVASEGPGHGSTFYFTLPPFREQGEG